MVKDVSYNKCSRVGSDLDKYKENLVTSSKRHFEIMHFFLHKSVFPYGKYTFFFFFSVDFWFRVKLQPL